VKIRSNLILLFGNPLRKSNKISAPIGMICNHYSGYNSIKSLNCFTALLAQQVISVTEQSIPGLHGLLMIFVKLSSEGIDRESVMDIFKLSLLHPRDLSQTAISSKALQICRLDALPKHHGYFLQSYHDQIFLS